MCGIAGGNLFTTDTIKESLDDTKHRGYDAQLVYEDGDMVLGHNRLSIQDLSENANQPFTDSSGRSEKCSDSMTANCISRPSEAKFELGPPRTNISKTNQML